MAGFSKAMKKPTISLCVICGNEETIIERFLKSAQPVMDELCLVRAAGNVETDKTVKLAREWCSLQGVPFHYAEYINKECKFPHVDDFSAARNMSFALASKHWQLWLDCDDTLTEENARRIRVASEIVGPVALSFDYAKPGGASCPRERMFRRGTGRWVNAIHETCQTVDGSPIHYVKGIEVHHAPEKRERPKSHERNLNILEKVCEFTPRHLFYLHEEQLKAGLRDAIPTGIAALALIGELSIDEHYEILLNLAELEPHKATERLFTAVNLQPHRREAFSILCQNALRQGHASAAVSYFRLMDCLPEPSPLPWTHRAIWYSTGWARHYLRVRVLRLSANPETREMAEVDHKRCMENPTYAQGVKTYEIENAS